MFYRECNIFYIKIKIYCNFKRKIMKIHSIDIYNYTLRLNIKKQI